MRTGVTLLLLTVALLAAEPIPPAEIPARAEEADTRLTQWLSLAEGGAVRAIASALPGETAGVERRARDPFAGLGRRRTSVELEDLERDWQRRSDRFAIWVESVSKHLAAVEEALTGLEGMRASWTATKAAGQDLPVEVVQRIRGVLAAVEKAEPVLRAARRDVLALQDRLTGSQAGVREALRRIGAERDALRERLFSLDSPPLWAGLDLSIPLADQLRGASARTRRELDGWLAGVATQAYIHLGLTVLVFFLVLGLRRRVRDRLVEDESFAATERLLARPVAATLLIALAVVGWVYPQAPRLVTDFAGLALLAPILWLLFGLLELRAVLYFLALLYIVDRLRYFSIEGSTLHRLLLLAEAVIGIAGTRLLRSISLVTERRLRRWLVRGVRLVFALLVASLVANGVGAVNLATLLANGTVASVYLAVVLYAGGQVLSGIVAALLHTRVARLSRMVSQHGELVRRRVVFVLHLALFVAWLLATLSVFGLREPVFAAVAAVLGASLQVGTLHLSFGDVLAFFLVIYASVLISRILRFVLGEDVLPRLPLPRGVPTAITSVLHYFILLIGFFFATAAAGLDLSKLAFLIGALGVGIGFGLQNIVNNFVSGLILLFERPIKVGDWLEVQSLYGEVKRIGIRSSTLRTLDAAEVIIPNGNLLDSNVINWTLSDRKRRVEVNIGVAYGSDVGRVLEVLLEAVKTSGTGLEQPAPDVLFVGFGDSSLDFKVRFWIQRFREMNPALSKVHVAIHRALDEAGITIPFPQRDLHLRSADPDVSLGPKLSEPE